LVGGESMSRAGNIRGKVFGERLFRWCKKNRPGWGRGMLLVKALMPGGEKLVKTHWLCHEQPWHKRGGRGWWGTLGQRELTSGVGVQKKTPGRGKPRGGAMLGNGKGGGLMYWNPQSQTSIFNLWEEEKALGATRPEKSGNRKKKSNKGNPKTHPLKRTQYITKYGIPVPRDMWSPG